MARWPWQGGLTEHRVPFVRRRCQHLEKLLLVAAAMSPGRDAWMCRVAALGTSAPGPETQSKPKGTSRRRLCHQQDTERLRTPGGSLMSRNSLELYFLFAVKKEKCSSPEARWFSRGGST